ncbi:glycosyltransferase family 4 protein [Polynucleobacter sp. AP-Sanab-80-C2]|uniref:glycosyltransferase family 4 protein n=1 Tax=Polynucleobacter sp. AP-Sanab-80-C2 TaxID=3108274 RepID=UPI002B222ABC|nr:glycosyltransferase family 4 protein [Polynucleobacter sp. AP-Sanab-80-C2]MEA9598541.1 glycosyltransferase family 4 protein [Polynucleobacter sp. AP-Sanab-80-C2]
MHTITPSKSIKTVVIIGDAYPPLQSSASQQLKDLAIEFLNQDIIPTVITSDSELMSPYLVESVDGVKILRLKTLRYKDVSLIRRALAEISMSFFMIRNYQKSSMTSSRWEGIIWYSPSIFLSLFVYYLKIINACQVYLILRDFFPAWALDLGLIKKGFFYYFAKCCEKFQYSVADFIGIQSFGNLGYFRKCAPSLQKKIQVLQNWLAPIPVSYCSISVSELPIANKKIFIYAGNMGVAQGMGVLIELAEILLYRSDIGFLFVGRGADVERLKLEAKNKGLVNTFFFDQIKSDQIPGLYAQCHVGLIALDPRHSTHNIPGKFLSYLQSGLPVLAIINKENDLALLIRKYQVGKATSDYTKENLKVLAESIIDDIKLDANGISERCRALSRDLFSPQVAVSQILAALNSKK